MQKTLAGGKTRGRNGRDLLAAPMKTLKNLFFSLTPVEWESC